MQGNQQSGSQGGQQKPQTLSWSQPQQAQAPKQGTTAHSTPKMLATPAPKGSSSVSFSKVAMIFAVGVVIGWLVTWSWFDLRGGKSAPVSDTAQDSGSSALSVTGSSGSSNSSASGSVQASGEKSAAAISVTSPQPAGDTVTVSSISASEPVWAVVYEDNNGVTGRALGAARFTPARQSGTITLLRATLPNLTYFVGLTADAPDHTFSFKSNAPLLGSDGKQILTQFTAQ